MADIETERLHIREFVEDDAEFMLRLLNSPKFLAFIGDRGVGTVDEARHFIENRYRQSYRDHGYGLYAVALKNKSCGTSETKSDATRKAICCGESIGMCGFVRRESLPGPDLGFAYLPQFEGNGYAYEAASAMMKYGRATLGLDEILAITSLDNDASGRLLEKLGFVFNEIIDSDGEPLKLYSAL